ncbi:CG2034 [Drosophila busckii]|uniref:Elongator complex protein 5 n=1 Tax=Drosophila busckii TaxID=30019 RepID=A0A0M4EZQ9_DROBS|nr:elongator complex protein 5 [Drosophila busckii]ALC43907.1 CG2034 [Drosophila busckii]
MLSNLVVTNQKVVLIIDQLNRERIALKFIGSLLHEQGEGAEVKSLPIGTQLQHVASFDAFLNELSNNNNNNASAQSPGEPTIKPSYNVILPTLADLLSYQTPAYIFDYLNKLRRSDHVRRVFLWASPAHLQHVDADYILAGCEYLAELVLRLETETTLALISRKPGGGVSNKRYNCQVSKTEFQVSPLMESKEAKEATIEEDNVKAADPGGTFKIELDEDEMVARNALTLPYEQHNKEPTEGNIIYTPDADDDFDDEDPDEDLLI